MRPAGLGTVGGRRAAWLRRRPAPRPRGRPAPACLVSSLAKHLPACLPAWLLSDHARLPDRLTGWQAPLCHGCSGKLDVIDCDRFAWVKQQYTVGCAWLSRSSCSWRNTGCGAGPTCGAGLLLWTHAATFLSRAAELSPAPPVFNCVCCPPSSSCSPRSSSSSTSAAAATRTTSTAVSCRAVLRVLCMALPAYLASGWCDVVHALRLSTNRPCLIHAGCAALPLPMLKLKRSPLSRPAHRPAHCRMCAPARCAAPLPMLKLKDFPPKKEFSKVMPRHSDDFLGMLARWVGWWRWCFALLSSRHGAAWWVADHGPSFEGSQGPQLQPRAAQHSFLWGRGSTRERTRLPSSCCRAVPALRRTTPPRSHSCAPPLSIPPRFLPRSTPPLSCFPMVCHPTAGPLNLANHLPWYTKLPDLGPKGYIAYGRWAGLGWSWSNSGAAEELGCRGGAGPSPVYTLG